MIVKTHVDTYDAEVSVETLYHAVQKIKKGAMTNPVLDASYDYLNVRFYKDMHALAISRRNLRHVYEWPSEWRGEDIGRPLFHTLMAGKGKARYVTFNFTESTKPVPVRPELQGLVSGKHIFREKARIFESGEAVTINRKPGNEWLIFINEHKGAGYGSGESRVNESTGATMSKGPSEIVDSGNGKFKNQFQTAFFTWWTTQAGAGAHTDELANRLTRQTAIQLARFSSVKSRIAGYRGIINKKDATPEAKKNAEEAINAILMLWKKERRGDF